jgi:AcrR family transcriptional regulator
MLNSFPLVQAMSKKKISLYVIQHEETEKRILAVSKTLFLNLGFSQVTMEAIAKKAHLSRQRLYYYFANLDEIAYQIQTEDIKAFMKVLHQGLEFDPEANVEAKLHSLFDTVFAYRASHNDDFLFTIDFDAYYRKRKVNATLLEAYRQSYDDPSVATAFAQLFAEGTSDGEFRQDLNATGTIYLWINLFQILLERLAFFTASGQGHTPEQLSSFEKEAVVAFFAYLK